MTDIGSPGYLSRSEFDSLAGALRAAGYAVMAPRERDGAIVYEAYADTSTLPAGIHVEQAPGLNRVTRSGSPRWFDWSTGPQALKPLLFRPREMLWRTTRGDDGRLAFEAAPADARPLAVIGVRACDLAALGLQDRHFLAGACRDDQYAARRESLFLVAVNCTQPSATCFCASTGDGPDARSGFDLVLDELDDGFIVRSGSERGHAIAAGLPLGRVDAAMHADADAATARASAVQQRSLPAHDLRDALQAGMEHPHWQDIAARCLACGNCTSVCPTCFCFSEFDTGSLDGATAEHHRLWDSCFTEGHSAIHGRVVHPRTRERYRQWLTHKLGGWHEQYGRSGCVGCGRCITWCPVGIDFTAEAAAVTRSAP